MAAFPLLIAILVHTAEQYHLTLAYSGQSPDLRLIQRALARMGPRREHRRQEKYIRAGTIGLMNLSGIMDRRAVNHVPFAHPLRDPPVHAVGTPKRRQSR